MCAGFLGEKVPRQFLLFAVGKSVPQPGQYLTRLALRDGLSTVPVPDVWCTRDAQSIFFPEALFACCRGDFFWGSVSAEAVKFSPETLEQQVDHRRDNEMSPGPIDI